MNIKPLFDKVVVESVTVEEKTKSGFFLPTSAQEKLHVSIMCLVVSYNSTMNNNIITYFGLILTSKANF